MTPWPLAIAAAVIAPLISVAVTPRRWLKRSMALVLASPVILYAAIIVWEMLTRPPEANALGLAFSGFMLMSAVLAIPWLAICLAGFAIGFRIRRLVRGRRDQGAAGPQAPSETAALTEPAPSPASETTDMAHWISVHIGFSHDGLKIDDVDVWEHEWRDVAGSQLRLEHPAYPRQIHTYRLFDAGDEGQSTRFAASELSNGVWGFYVAAPAAAAPSPAIEASSGGDENTGRRAAVRPNAPAGWRIGLLILVGSLLAIAAASHRMARYSPPPAQELTPMPKMPDFAPPPRPPIQP